MPQERQDTIRSFDDLKSLFAKYHDRNIFVTGHSLGLPSAMIFLNQSLALTFGGWEVFQGIQHPEQTKKLRVLRTINKNDLVTTIPSWGLLTQRMADSYLSAWLVQQEVQSLILSI